MFAGGSCSPRAHSALCLEGWRNVVWDLYQLIMPIFTILLIVLIVLEGRAEKVEDNRAERNNIVPSSSR